MQKIVGVSLSEETLTAIDRVRGDVPRSRFIQRRLEDALKKEGKKQ
jgi:hypothetical protein